MTMKQPCLCVERTPAESARSELFGMTHRDHPSIDDELAIPVNS